MKAADGVDSATKRANGEDQQRDPKVTEYSRLGSSAADGHVEVPTTGATGNTAQHCEEEEKADPDIHEEAGGKVVDILPDSFSLRESSRLKSEKPKAEIDDRALGTEEVVKELRSEEQNNGCSKLSRVASMSSCDAMTTGQQSPRTRSASAPPKEIITTKQIPSGSQGSSPRKAGIVLRRGKWTVEEEAYVARVIQDFNSGFLDAPAGTTLRTYLSEKLQCDPMRITKKFTGDACIGKRVFHPAIRSPSNASAIDRAQAELDCLERRWRRRLEMQQRESAKKAAASAAAAAVASGQGSATALGLEESLSNSSDAAHQNAVARTAAWLDRAKSALKEPAMESSSLEEADALENQMQEVQRLIHEGPIIQQSSAGIPHMLDHAQETTAPTASNGGGEMPPSQVEEPADKRMRTAEDAEALVGFLRSVRASAASGGDI